MAPISACLPRVVVGALLVSRLASFDIDASSPQEDDFLLGWNTDYPQASAYIASSPLFFGRAYSRLLAAAEQHVQSGRLGDALRAYDSVLDGYGLRGEEQAPVLLAKGAVLASMSLFAPAERAFARVADASRRYAHLAHFSLGLLASRRGRFAEAMQSYGTALFYKESFFPATHNLGSLHLVRGHLEKGIRMYEAALEQLERAGLLDAAGLGVADEASVGAGGDFGAAGAAPSADAAEAAAAASAAAAAEAAAAEAEISESLNQHLIDHVLSAFTLTDAPRPGGAGSAGPALLAALPGSRFSANAEASRIGRSLRSFLRRLQTLDLAAFHRGIGIKLQEIGAFEDGVAHLRRALALSPEYGSLQLHCTLSLPAVYSSREELWAARATLARNVREALEDRITVVHPEKLYELFFLTYQLPFTGLPAHLLMRDISRLFSSSEAPVLRITAPELYTAYPLALSHATGNSFWQRYAPYGRIAAPEAGAFVRPHVTDYFVMGVDAARSLAATAETQDNVELVTPVADETVSSSVRAARAHVSAPRAAAAGRGSGSVVRVGILTYQLHDCAVGNLVSRLILHLHGYHLAQEKVLSRSPAGGARRYSEAPTAGAGTRPRFLAPDLSNWERDRGGNSRGAREDPMVEHGFVTVPGVAAFNVTLFRLTYMGDSLTRRINALADQVVMLKTADLEFDIERVRAAVARENVDVLIASDPGIQPGIYSLLFARMAPVQVALWGADRAHTLTLGLPDSIDYFAVGDSDADAASGGDGGRSLHSQILEQTVRLGDAGTFFSPLAGGPITDAERLRAAAKFGLLDARHLYLCPQTVEGIHPDYDDVISGVLAADAQAEIMLFADAGQQLWLAKLQSRLQQHPEMTRAMAERLRFVPAFPPGARRELATLMSVVEVVLDTFPVGIGALAFEALDVGAAVVSLPARQMPRSFTGGLLGRLAMTRELAANGTADYIAKAVAVATNSTHRASIRRRLQARRAVHAWKPSSDTDAATKTGSERRQSPSQQQQQQQRQQLQQQKRRGARRAAEPAASLPGWESKILRETGEDDETTGVLDELEAQGRGDAAQSTLNDWLRFIGRAGRPWAEDRESGQLEAANAAKMRRAAGAPSSGRKRRAAARAANKNAIE